MPRLSRRRESSHEEDEGYFVSMSDMLTGLLFIFIILLLYFALQSRQVTQELTGATVARTQLLKDLEARLREQGVRVSIDPETGVLRLPESILFESGSSTLKLNGIGAVQKVANALMEELPCYTDEAAIRCKGKPSAYRIDALFIEGHTDAVPFMRGGRDINLDLSADRAITTFLALTQQQPSLETLTTTVSGRQVPILSVSGYGPKRPVPDARSDQENRRIDLRFLMVTPDPKHLQDMLVQ